MNVIYNIAINAVNSALKFYGRCIPREPRRKFPRFVRGRCGLLDRVEADMSAARATGDDRPVVWFHSASLGEFQIARPLIRALKDRGDCRIVMTFFSPSGYEGASAHNDGLIDHIYYLPLDTHRYARRFVEALRPAAAVVMVSEYWPNMLQQLKFHAVPTILVSAVIRDDSQFFRWYGKIYRKALSTFRRIFVLNEESAFNLRMLGYTDAKVSGDPLFDNAALVARTTWSDLALERFCQGDMPVFVAGSISDDTDAAIVARLTNKHTDVKFILVPHDITPRHIAELERRLDEPALRLSRCDADTNMAGSRIMIVDCIGKLAYLYRYATWAYVGGGFTKLLHSVIEPVVYGVPVAFGPRIERKVTPAQLIERGIGRKVSSAEELDRWLTEMKSDPELSARARREAREYVDHNVGATAEIVDEIAHAVWPR